MLLGAAVEGEAGVVLTGDVRGVLDPQPLDHVALDVEPEDVAGVGADLVGVVGQLDAAGLAAAPHLDLGLDHHRVARRLRLGDGLVHGVGHPALGDGDAEAGEVLLTLVFEEIHRIRSSLSVAALSSRCGLSLLCLTALSCRAVVSSSPLPGSWSCVPYRADAGSARSGRRDRSPTVAPGLAPGRAPAARVGRQDGLARSGHPTLTLVEGVGPTRPRWPAAGRRG